MWAQHLLRGEGRLGLTIGEDPVAEWLIDPAAGLALVHTVQHDVALPGLGKLEHLHDLGEQLIVVAARGVDEAGAPHDRVRAGREALDEARHHLLLLCALGECSKDRHRKKSKSDGITPS
jgi:hypothetical protein